MIKFSKQIESLLEIVPVAMVVSDGDGKIVRANELAFSMLGKTSSEVIGFFLDDLTRNLPIELKTNPSIIAGENFHLTSLQDIQAQQHAESAHQMIKERYEALLESTDASIAMFDYDGILQFANSIAAQRLGMTLQEVVGKHMSQLFPPQIASRQLKSIQEVIRTQKGQTLESKTVLQGQSFWHRTSIQPVRNSQVKVNSALINAVDITQQKQAEDALRENEDRLQLALKGIDLGWWDCNITNGTIIFNEHWNRFMGFDVPDQELPLMDVIQRIHPEDLKVVQKIIVSHFKNKPAYSTYEYRIRTEDGQWKWILDLGKVIEWNEQGRAIRAAGICLDITNRVYTEKALLEQKQLLERKNEELEEFSYLSAHDLKSPIVSIVALLEHLYQNNIDHEQKEKMTQVLLQSARQIQAKIISLNEIIALKKTFDLKPQNIELAGALQRTRELLGATLRKENVDIQYDFSACPSVYFPSVHLESVLQNLISNAIKFKKENETPKIHLYTVKTPNLVKLVIQDNGIGFDIDRNSEKVFGIFNRFHSKKEGIGTGLYIVRSIMDHYHGKIEIESKLNGGTTVSLYFREQSSD